ncbi:hypothetical protein K8S17_02470, partial [bacterium]|nr:hypothetical protein [bacterium]
PITTGFHTGLSGCYLDADFYTIEMAAGETLTVTLDATFQQGDWEHRRMYIRSPSGDGYLYNGTDNPLTVQATATSDGTAHFYVQFWENDVSYTLDVELSN